MRLDFPSGVVSAANVSVPGPPWRYGAGYSKSTSSVSDSPDAVYTFTAPLPFQFVRRLWRTPRSQSFATKLILPGSEARICPGGIVPVTVAYTVPVRALMPPVQQLSGLVR